MTSVDEQQLALAAAVGQNGNPSAQRVSQLQGAVERLNTIATNLRKVAADIEWSGPAALAAQTAFSTLAGAINEHADAINAIAAADAGTDEILSAAHQAYQGVLSIDTSPGHSYPGSGMVGNEKYREMEATQAREQLDTDMVAARGRLVSAASWDLDPPLPPEGDDDGEVTGIIPDGVPVTTLPPAGGFDPTGPVVGTVPPGSTSVPTPGGFDPTGPVTGTVPYGSTSAPPGDGGVTGTVPTGPTDPGSGYDPAGTRPSDPGGSNLAAPRDVLSNLTSRLGPTGAR